MKAVAIAIVVGAVAALVTVQLILVWAQSQQ